MKQPRFQFIEQDIREEFDVPYKIDEIYNLACPASPIHYQKDPIGTIRTNVEGMFQVKSMGILQFILRRRNMQEVCVL